MGTSHAPPDRPDYDQPLKRMLAQASQGFVELIAPGLIWQSELPSELPAATRRADIVWKVARADGRIGILHVELQTKVEKGIVKRVVEYGFRIWLREEIGVQSILVLLRSAKTVPQSPLVVHWMEDEDELFRFNFRVVRLWEVPRERVLATADYALWPLSGLMAGTTVENTLDVAARIAEVPIPRSVQSELIDTLALLSSVNLPLDAILDAIRRHPSMEDIFLESSLGQYLIQQGREEGREEGQRQMARGMAQVALEGRFGPLNADVLAAVNAADEAVLRDIVAHIGTDSMEQVRKRLGVG
ncbi:MAG: hypothetical protein ACRDHP_14410 [Ktedonobacterales bacterium]